MPRDFIESEPVAEHVKRRADRLAEDLKTAPMAVVRNVARALFELEDRLGDCEALRSLLDDAREKLDRSERRDHKHRVRFNRMRALVEALIPCLPDDVIAELGVGRWGAVLEDAGIDPLDFAKGDDDGE